MKRYFFVLFSLLITSFLFAQKDKFPGLHGVKSSHKIEIEYMGRKIGIVKEEATKDIETDINKIARYYGLGRVIKRMKIEDTKWLGTLHYIFESEKGEDDDKTYTTTFMIPQDYLNWNVVILQELSERRDLAANFDLVKAYLSGEFDPYLTLLGSEVGAFKLLDFTLSLPQGEDSAEWYGANFIKCHDDQCDMSWSVFASQEEAFVDNEFRVQRFQNTNGRVVLDKELEIRFAGKPTIARVITFFPNKAAKDVSEQVYDKYFVIQQMGDYYISLEFRNQIKAQGNRRIPEGFRQLIAFDDGDKFTKWLSIDDYKEAEKRLDRVSNGSSSEYVKEAYGSEF